MDPYAVLGLSQACSEADMKRAYRSLALKYHPDKAGPEGVEKMKEINIAYEKLIAKVWMEVKPTSSSPRFQSGASAIGPESSDSYASQTKEEYEWYKRGWRMFDELNRDQTELGIRQRLFTFHYQQSYRSRQELDRQQQQLNSMRQQLNQRWREYYEQYPTLGTQAEQFYRYRQWKQPKFRESSNKPLDPWTTIHQSFLGGKFRAAWSDLDPPGSLVSQQSIHQYFRGIMQRFEAHVFKNEPNPSLTTSFWTRRADASSVQAFDAPGEDLLKNLHRLWQSNAPFTKLWFEIGKLHHHLKCFKLAYASVPGLSEMHHVRAAGFRKMALHTGLYYTLQEADLLSGVPSGVAYNWANTGFFASLREVDEALYRQENGDLVEGWEEFDGEIT